MAFGDTIQSGENSNTIAGAGSLAVTITFGATATSGNLLALSVAYSQPILPGSGPTDWTLLQDSGLLGNFAATTYWKISDGTETAVTVTATAVAATTVRAAVGEFAGPFAGTPLDVSAEDASNISTVVTSQPTGTTGTTAQNDELAIGFWGAQRTSLIDGTRTYTNSFTEVVFPATFTARACAWLAKKVLTTTGTQTCTYGCTDTGDEMYGAVATFKKASAATANISNMCLMGVG